MPNADTAGMSAVALEIQQPLRPIDLSWVGATPIDEYKAGTTADVEPWELHSELVLVCPELCALARELMPARDPEAFLARLPAPTSLGPTGDDKAALAPSLPVAVVRYSLSRLLDTARTGLLVVAAVVALAMLGQLLH